MSHDIEKRQPNTSPDRPSDKDPENTWLQIQSDLRGALDTWTELSHKSQGKKTTEEKTLEDMRRLLADLKSRMKDFE